jgi:hypothetical protein
MHLAWPAEREVLVEAVRSGETTGTEGTQTVTLKARYQTRILRTEGGYQAELGDGDFTIDGRRVPDGDAAAVVQGLVLYGRIDSNGRLIAFFDIDAFQARVRAMYLQQFQGKAPEAEIERSIARLTTRDVLQSVAGQTWSALVGDWVGSEFRVGVAQPMSLSMPLMGMDETYQLAGHATVSGYEKCTPSFGTATCVRLRFSARADPTAVKHAIERGIRSFGRSVPYSPDDTVDIHFELELLTEPQTLTPYWARWAQELHVTSSTGGPASSTTHRETTTFSFAYAEPGKAN